MVYFYIFLSIFGFVGTSLVSAQLTRSYSSFETGFFRAVILSFFLLPALFIGGFDGLNFYNILAMCAIGLIAGVGFFIQLESTKYLPVSIVTALVRLYNIPVIILGYLFFQETLSFYQAVGAAILLGAGLLLAFQKNTHKHLEYNPVLGISLVFLRIITQVLWIMGFSHFARDIGPYTIAFFSEFTTLFGFFLLIGIFTLQKKKVFSNLNKTFFCKNVIVALFSVCFSIGFYSAIQIAPVSFVTLFLSSATLFVAIFGNIFLGEYLSKIQWGLIIISFGGLILLNV